MKKIIAIILSLTICMGVFAPIAAAAKAEDTAEEKILRLIVPENWEMDIGDSRTVDYAIQGTEKRMLTWTAEPADVAKVDKWGRVTALKEGKAEITATTEEGLTDTITLNVVTEPTKIVDKAEKVDYTLGAVKEGDNLQKVVTRYELDDKAVPANVKDKANYEKAQTATTKDGAVWTITDYGVLRVDEKATNERDKEQRFMGDRYFYAADTGKGKVLAIFADGENGIWTVMEEGYSHIEMLDMDGTEKAEILNDQTWEYVARRGMVSNAFFEDGAWKPEESDNDGLWTSMYAGGELMRYATLKNDPDATPEQIEEARKTATLSTEAVLFLTYISMRQGTVESYNRAQRSGTVVDLETGKYYTSEATLVDGDYSQNIPFKSPATMFDSMYTEYMDSGKRTYLQLPEENLKLFNDVGWANPMDKPDEEYDMRTRNLEGFWSRTYSFRDENNDYDSFAYWSHNGDGTATGVSTKVYDDGSDFLLHGENYRGLEVDATGEIPERLWNDLIPEGKTVEDIVYKGDTSSDEIIGHVFLYKLAYDILGPEDPELAALIVNTMDKFAQHLVDNSYNMVDGSGQPTTWAKFSRTYFHNGQVLGGAPLNAMVLLTVFKVAAHVTGYQKWEDEYRMAAFDEQYQYAEIMTQELERYQLSILEYVNDITPILGRILRHAVGTKLFDMAYKLILNHSDEEMAMLGFYTLFQLEDDEELLKYYREALDDWWFSMQNSENPLWYYVYQLAYPDEEKKDAYGNSLIETASWSLSRHPMDLRRFLATNGNRDDVYELDLDDVGIGGTNEISFDPNAYTPAFWDSNSKVLRIVGMLFGLTKLEQTVAAPDERAFHKYNGSSYDLDDAHNIYEMEGSTTYSLPYWMGRYHGMLEG